MFLILISLFYSSLPSCLLNYVTIDNSYQCSSPLSYYNFFFLFSETFILLQVVFLLQSQAAVLLLKSADEKSLQLMYRGMC